MRVFQKIVNKLCKVAKCKLNVLKETAHNMKASSNGFQQFIISEVKVWKLTETLLKWWQPCWNILGRTIYKHISAHKENVLIFRDI